LLVSPLICQVSFIYPGIKVFISAKTYLKLFSQFENPKLSNGLVSLTEMPLKKCPHAQ